MAEPSRCRFCDEPLKPDNEGSECDAGCKAGFSLFAPKDEDDEDEPTAAPTDSAPIQTGSDTDDR